jgi:hypothetical protein
MKKAGKPVVVTVEDALGSMTPGERHTLYDIARRGNGSIPNVQTVLNECVARRAVSHLVACPGYAAITRRRQICSDSHRDR